VPDDIVGGVSDSEDGIDVGSITGADVIAEAFGFDGLRATFLATGFGAGAAFFFGAALTTFFATFFAAFFTAFLALFLAELFAFAFTAGRVFFLATLFLTEPRLALATGRFFDFLLFFAMINLLLEIVRTRCESSPEKVCCHLCMMLESCTWIA
jgi:hypothetical protein